jgi:WD40 repeat protein
LPCERIRLPDAHPVVIAFSPDGQSLVTVGAGPWSIARWDVQSGLSLGRNPLDLAGTWRNTALSHDHQWVAVVTREQGLSVWNATAGRRESVLNPSPGLVASIDFSPDGRYLLQRSEGGEFSVRQLWSGRVTRTPWSHLKNAIWTPSGEIIAVRDAGKFLRWDPRSGRTQEVSRKHAHPTGWSAAVSPDGRTLAWADPETQVVQLWSAETLELKAELPVNLYALFHFAFTPDGKTFASACADGTVKLWDVATGQELLTLEGQSNAIWIVRFSPDGEVLAALSARDGSGPPEVFFWRAAPADLEPAGPSPGQGGSRP